MQFKKLIVQSLVWRGLYFFTVLLLNILIARFFKANGSGWIFYLTNFYAFVIVAGSLSLESGMGFYISRQEIATAKLLHFSLVWTFIIGIIVLISCYFYSNSSSNLLNLKKLLFVSSFSYVCGNMLTSFGTSIFYARKNFISPNIICIAVNLLLICLLVVMRWGAVPGLTSTVYLQFYFLSFLLQGLTVMLTLFLRATESLRFMLPSREEFRRLLRYSLVAFTANLIFFLVYRVDYWIVEKYCSAVDLGNYIQVSKLGQLLIILPSILGSAVFPSVAGGQTQEVNKLLKRLSRMLLLVVSGPCLLLALAGSWAFPLVFGPSFSHMYPAFLLTIPGVLSISALYPLTAYYSGKDMIGVNIRGSALALCFIVALDLLFIPMYGIMAAAAVSSLGYMLYHAYVLLIFRKEYHTSINGFFVVKKSDFSFVKNFLVNSYIQLKNEKQQ